MASSTAWRVYDRHQTFQAACRDTAAAAALAAFYGLGATIRHRHGQILWHEGREAQPASESYDYVDRVLRLRLAVFTSHPYPTTDK